MDYEVQRRSTRLLAWSPVPISALFVLGMADERLRSQLTHYLSERGPLELGTFVLLALGGILGIRVWWLGRGMAPRWHSPFFLVFGVGLLLVSMEEIAWGQSLFGFDSPGFFEQNNVQGETTLHNLPGIHGRFSILYQSFCVGGLIGAFAPIRVAGKQVVPPIVVPMLFVTLLLASYQMLHTLIDLGSIRINFGGKIPELVEFWIGMIGLGTSAWNLKLVRSRNSSAERT